jgi:hypothetical protein
VAANPHSVIDTFRKVARLRQRTDAVASSATSVVKAFYRNPDDLIAFIERQGTPVFLLHNNLLSKLVLALLGFEAGFIAPRATRQYRWAKALLYRLQPQTPWVDESTGFFVLTHNLKSVGFLAHQLHHWMAFNGGLPGYEANALSAYRKFWSDQKGLVGPEVYRMSLEQIQSLRDAINRDMEALRFIRQVTEEVLAPSNQSQAFKQFGYSVG